VYGLVLLATLLISAWRLNELTLGSASRGAWLPFLHPLLGAGFEVSLLLALPPALLGARAAGLSWRACCAAFLVLASISAVGAMRLDPGTRAPGQLAEQLLRDAREHCAESSERKAVVPLIGMTWSCPPGAPVRLEGRAPVGKGAEFRAADVHLAPDLRSLSVDDVTLRLAATARRGEIRVSAQRAVIRGLSPWGRPADVPLVRRLARAALAALLTSIVGLWALETGRWSAALGTLAGLLAGVAAFLTQRSLDRLDASSAAYFSLALVGPGVIALTALAVYGIKRFFSRTPVAR
jgi:hypothetical protein